MLVQRSALIGVLCGIGVSALVAVSGSAVPPGNGGCYQGGQVASWLVPGTGSAGQNVHSEVNMWICESPLLPGIDAGKLTYEVPFGGGPGWVRFNWSDGSVSNGNGGGNNLWGITDGPAAGHSIQLNLIDDSTTDINGDTTDIYIFQSAIFMS